jgi:hypothetical protein
MARIKRALKEMVKSLDMKDRVGNRADKRGGS